MKVIKVDSLDTESFQGPFNGGPDILRPPISSASAQDYAELSRQEDLVAFSSTFKPEKNK